MKNVPLSFNKSLNSEIKEWMSIMRGRSVLLMSKIRIITMVMRCDHPLYIFTHRDVSAAQISHATMSRKMKRTFIFAFPVRVSWTSHPSFILHLIRASSRRGRTSLQQGSSWVNSGEGVSKFQGWLLWVRCVGKTPRVLDADGSISKGEKTIRP